MTGWTSNALFPARPVLDRVLNKGIVIDVAVRVSLVAIDLHANDSQVRVASVDTYLRYSESVPLERPVLTFGSSASSESALRVDDDDDDGDDGNGGGGPSGAPAMLERPVEPRRRPASRGPS